MKKLSTILFLFFAVINSSAVTNSTYIDFLKVTVKRLKKEAVKDTVRHKSSNEALKADNLLATSDSLIDHKEITLIDSLWLQEMYNSPLYDTIQYAIDIDDSAIIDYPELPTDLLKKRFAHLNSTTPFNVEYNPSLERIIKSYLKNRRETFQILMSRAQYYFPLFEEYLAKYDMPLELKYLAIVESALRPRAKSRVGAAGLWQFMYQTGKQYDLNVSSYVDERYDPLKATEAACKYLSTLYKIFGDWDMALAAYNSGPGNVNKAIRRSGGQRNYWAIRNYLPRETAAYVPIFYATLYIFEYAEEHKLRLVESKIKHFETDTIHVKRQVTFEQLTNFLSVDKETLQLLNPQYKLDIIPFIKKRDYYVRLPLYNIGEYASNENKLYAYIDAEELKRKTELPKYVEDNNRIRYKVVSGDFLGKIANKYGVSVSSIKRWNGLKSNRLKIGQRLTIYPRKHVSSSSSKKKSKPTTKITPKGKYTIYTVKSGDSLWKISQKYPSVSVQNLQEWNDIWSAKSLKPGMKIKIY